MTPPKPISDKLRHQLTQARAALARKRQAMRLQIEIPDLQAKPRRVRHRPPVTRQSEQAGLFDPPMDDDVNPDQ